MNRIYRSIWNVALNTWVAAPETASGMGKSSASSTSHARGDINPRLLALNNRPLSALTLAIASFLAGVAAPQVHAQTVTTSGGVSQHNPDPSKPFEAPNYYVVGSGGSPGELRVENGGQLSSGHLTIGEGNQGLVVVKDTGSSWISSDELFVSTYNNGTLEIKNGGTVSIKGGIYVGVDFYKQSTGTIIVSGKGSKLTGSRGMIVGYAPDATGILTIDDNAHVITGFVTLRFEKAANAELNISNGGILEIQQLRDFNTTEDGQVTIDGGIIRARQSVANFFSKVEKIEVKAGGVTIDSNGYDIGINTNFTGAGGFIKQGGGTLTLGLDSTYSGKTLVQAGTLLPATNKALSTGDVIIGNSGQNAVLQVNNGIDLANNITVGNQGFLVGTGSVGATTVQSGGTVAAGSPGNATGTLTVDGGLKLDAGSTFLVSTIPDWSSSKIQVNGAADLNGRLLHIGHGVNFEVNKFYTVLTATGGVSGTFSSLEDHYAFLDLESQTVGNDLQLRWLRNSHEFSDFALTPNQIAVADNVETHVQTGPIYQFVQNLEETQVADALDSLSGEIHANILGRLENVSSKVADVGSRRLFSDLPAWVEVEGNWRNVKGDGNAAKLKQNTTGLYLGMNQDIGQSGWRAGGLLGYSRMNTKSHARYSSADINNYSAAAYVGKGFEHGGNRINVLGGLSYTHHSIDTERSVPLLGQQLKADYNAKTAQLFAEVGYAIPWDAQSTVEPFAGLTVARQRVDGFHERGGFAELNSGSASQTHTHMTLGVRGRSQMQLADKDVQLHATLGWRHGFGSKDATRAMAFTGVGSEFSIAGVPLARNTALVGLQAQAKLNRNALLELGYNGEFGGRTNAHAIHAKLSWAF